MANGKRILRLFAIVITLAGVLGFQLEAMGTLGAAEDSAGRPGVIMIDTIAELEALDQAAVVFDHDAHTKALKDQGLSCVACHRKDADGRLALAFDRREGDARPEKTSAGLKDMYHQDCVSCHVESGAKGFETGPMVGECRRCHQESPEVTAQRVAAGMDDALHFVHWNSKEISADPGKETNCGSCHEKAGEEDSWRFSAEAKAVGVKDVFHSRCVTCHATLVEQKAERSGPVLCAGCHGREEVAARGAQFAENVKAMDGVLPRLPRKQPDVVLMTPPNVAEKPSGMAYVAFDHKFHESRVDNCLTCHTQGVNAKLDTRFEALHDVRSDSSCIGCHAVEQQKPECVGCHALRPRAKALSEATCASCHNAGLDDEGKLMSIAAEAKAEREALAGAVIAARPQAPAVAPESDIPEFVTIGALADQYKPSKLPHRKIVRTLQQGMQGSPLATAFHSTPEAVCAACHHNSPASTTPPKCASCHSEPFAVEGRPGLKAAYHGQCMTCHQEMKLEKPAATDCVACHEKKTN